VICWVCVLITPPQLWILTRLPPLAMQLPNASLQLLPEAGALAQAVGSQLQGIVGPHLEQGSALA
jgi:hypothetical protein